MELKIPINLNSIVVTINSTTNVCQTENVSGHLDEV